MTTPHSSQIAVMHAIEVASVAHHNQFDRNGDPHIMHVARVALKGWTYDEITVGWLHDVVEDNGNAFNEEFLRREFPEHIADAVMLLTRRPNEYYDEYIDSLLASGNELAMRVKLNDLEDNIARNDEHKPFKYLSAQTRIRRALDLAKEPTNNGWLDAESHVDNGTMRHLTSSSPDDETPVSSTKTDL